MNYQCLKPLYLLVFSVLIYYPLPSMAQVIKPAQDGTGTLINTEGHHFNIRGGKYNSDRRNLFHSFDRFNLNTGQTANFITTPQVKNILAKIRGGETSLINGLLQITGSQANLFLINPVGIIFGPQARLNLPAAFTATTATGIQFQQLWLSVFGSNDYNNLLNNPTAYQFHSHQPAIIWNQANLSLLPKQSLHLLAGAVLNTGTISVPGGNITLTAMTPDKNILKVSPTGHILNWEFTTDHNLTNFLQQPQSLPALLTGPINHLPADTIVVNTQGQVVLQTNGEIISSGQVIVSNNINVSDLNSGKTAGVVNIFGDKIQLINTNIQANGDHGGGTVRIGGDVKGTGVLPSARHTLIDPQSQINANALTLGDGGQIVVWSQENTKFTGTINAIAGKLSGDGGFVEISSKNNVLYEGKVNLTSINGKSGTLLLDPENIIVSGTGINDSELNDREILATDHTKDTLTIAQTTLENLDGNIILEANNNITFETLTNNQLNFKSSTGDITFSADADGNGIGNLLMQPADQIITNGRNITIKGVEIQLGNINTSGDIAGNITILTNTGNITTGDLISAGINQGGNILVQGSNIITGIRDASSMNGQAGNININRMPLINNSQLTNTLPETLPEIEIPTLPEPPNIEPPGNNTAGNITAVPPPNFPNFPTVPNVPPPANNTNDNEQNISTPSVPNFPNNPNIQPPSSTPSDQIVSDPGIPSFPSFPNIQPPQSNGATVPSPGIPSFPSFPNIQPPSSNGAIVPSPEIPNFPTLPNLRPPLPTEQENFIPEPNIPNFPAPPNLKPPLSIEQENFIPEPNIPNFPPPPNLVPPPSASQVTKSNVMRIASSLQVNRTQNNDSSQTIFNDENLVIQSHNNWQGSVNNETVLTIESIVLPGISNNNIQAVTSTVDDIFTSQFTEHLNTEFNNKFPSIETVQATLQKIDDQTGKKPAIIYVIVRSDQIDLIVVPPEKGKITSHTVSPVTRDTVLNTANDLRREITNPNKRGTKSYLPFAQQMYQWIIAPLKQDLQDLQIDTLGFVLDAGLRTIPIATLHDGEKFIIENYSVGLIPSVNLVDMTYRSMTDAHILAMGASQFQELSPLPAVPTELSTITREWQGKYFLNRDFTLENLRRSRTKYPYRIVHLATHGEFQAGDISNSFIQLWDEKLRLDQLRELQLSNPQVDLLVLSACRTAVGDETVELGFAGLAVQAGAKSALASLWYVSDEGTLAIMANFYHYLQIAPIKSDALRLAQIDMIQGRIKIEEGTIRGKNFQDSVISLPTELSRVDDQVLSHPYYWAAFTMIGSPW